MIPYFLFTKWKKQFYTHKWKSTLDCFFFDVENNVIHICKHSVLYFTMYAQNGLCATCCILKMSHVLPWWQQINVAHIEDKRKNIHNMCGKKHVIQIMIWFCQSKLFLMKKFYQCKKKQNKWILIGNFARLWRPLRFFL